MNPKIIAISFEKGGTGKTTTAYHLANSGKRVLVIDLDPQRNLSNLFMEDNQIINNNQSSFQFLKRPTNNFIKINKKIDLLPASYAGFTFDLETSLEEVSALVEPLRIELSSYNYDWIIIDCPPGQTLGTILSQILCTDLIIPIQTRQASVQGIHDMFAFFKEYQIQARKWILPTMMDKRIKSHKLVLESLRETFSDSCLEPIPLSAAIEDVFTWKAASFESSSGQSYKHVIEKLAS